MANPFFFGRVCQARYLAAQLKAANPVLLDGEVVYEFDTGKYKIGTGTAPWNALPYKSPESGQVDMAEINRLLAAKADTSLANVTLERDFAGTYNHYYKAPDGLLLQWGMVAAQTNTNAYFPVAFMVKPLAVLCQLADIDTAFKGSVFCSVSGVTPTSFNIRINAVNGTTTVVINPLVYWLALGRWK